MFRDKNSLPVHPPSPKENSTKHLGRLSGKSEMQVIEDRGLTQSAESLLYKPEG